MKLFEVKNDIAKILYNPAENHLLPSDFLLIEDSNQKLITQIINIETISDSVSNTAELKLILSIDKDENLSFYTGYIPSKDSKIIYINPGEILELIKSTKENIYFGNLANHQTCVVKAPIDFVDDKLYILSDRKDSTAIIVKNLLSQLKELNKKIILLDFDGSYKSLTNVTRVKIAENFKLPLNINAFNTIYENDLTDCPLEDKALIQSIILELREYLKTLEDKFIPFTMFKNVVDDEFLQNPSSGLMLLRNKLWMYAQDSIFAENKEQFDILNTDFEKNNILIVDVSDIEYKWFKFIIETIAYIIRGNYYLIMDLDDVAMDKKTINNIYNSQNIIPVISTSYSYKNSQLLKSYCNNRILCKTLNEHHEKEQYGVLANKLNLNEFMIYGESTLYIPLIIELQAFNALTNDEVIQNEIKKDVDDMLTTSKKIVPSNIQINDENNQDLQEISKNEAENLNPYNSVTDDDLTDSDLDFLDDLKNNDIVKPEAEASKKSDEDIVNDSLEALQETKYDVFTPETENKDTEDLLNDIGIDFDEEQDDIINSDNSETTAEIVPIEDDSDFDELFTDSEDDEVLIEETPSENEIIEENQDDIIMETNEPIQLQEGDFIDIGDLDTEEAPIVNEELNDNISENIETETESEKEETSITLPKNNEHEPSVEIKQELPEEQESTFIDDIVESIEAKQNSKQSEIKQIQKEEPEPKDEVEPSDSDNTEENETVSGPAENSILSEFDEENDYKKEEQTINNQKTQQKNSQNITVYETDKPKGVTPSEIPFKVGDRVFHPKHGKGIVEGFTNYSNKILFCQIEFENVGRRILDPLVAGIEKI